ADGRRRTRRRRLASAVLQENAAAAEVGQRARQWLAAFGADREQQLHAVGQIALLINQCLGFCQPLAHQGMLGEGAVATERLSRNDLLALAGLQALGRAATVGAHQSTGAEQDAAIPANHQHHYLIEILSLDGGEDRSSGRAAGFAVVVEAVLLADLPGPAVVGSIGCAVRGDEPLGFGCVGHRGGQGQEAALADLLLVAAGGGKGPGHAGTSDWVAARAARKSSRISCGRRPLRVITTSCRSWLCSSGRMARSVPASTQWRA